MSAMGGKRTLLRVSLSSISRKQTTNVERLDKAMLEKAYNQARLTTSAIATRPGSHSPAVIADEGIRDPPAYYRRRQDLNNIVLGSPAPIAKERSAKVGV